MRRLLIAGVMLIAGAARDPLPSAARTCGGDCDGDGAVTVNEVVTAVTIVLGGGSLDACPAILTGGGRPGVAELVAAVGNALCACRPCPPPPPRTPTRTPTVTPRPPTLTPTVTATPTPTPVVSTWTEDMARLSGSTCPKQVNDAIRGQLGGQGGTYRISQQGGTATIENGAGEVEIATVDAAGVLRDTFTDSDSEGSCLVIVEGELAVSLRRSPSTATFRYRVTALGCARNLRCQLTIKSRWRRTDVSP